MKGYQLSILVALLLGSGSALATNGMAPTGLGMEHRAMGGAAVANPANTTSMATNPAAASFIEDGFDLGLEVFMPDRGGTNQKTGVTYDGNGEDKFLVPEGGYKRKLRGGKYAVGIAAYGNGGMNTSFEQTPTVSMRGGLVQLPMGTSKPTGIDLQQLFIAPTVSAKIGANSSVGLSINMVYQKFKAEGLENFRGFSAYPTNMTNQGYDDSTGIGATLGWQGKVSPNVTLGASYRLKTKMSKFDKYKGLFPDGGQLDVPAAATIGAAWQATPRMLVTGDIQQVYYSDVAGMGNDPHPSLHPFGSDGGAGFGWTDQTVYKIGMKYQATPRTAILAGANYGKSPADGSATALNLLAPGITEKHLSLGVEHKLSNKSKLIGTYVRTFKKELQGDGKDAIYGLDGYNIRMDQNAVGIAYSRQF